MFDSGRGQQYAAESQDCGFSFQSIASAGDSADEFLPSTWQTAN